MVSINYATREVTCKIVYYGPGLSGKTTNLQYIHDKVPGDTRGKMISLATEADRTLYFDFLPINIGKISGLSAKFQLYTVPGQVYYNATRKLVLRGADGLVFVADSQADKMDENIESINNMKENLAEYGYDINEMPIVIQYNKRDLPNVLPVEELEAKLNPYGWKYFEGEAVNGRGVFDTLKMSIKLVLDKARHGKTDRGAKKEADADSKREEVHAAAEGQATPAANAASVKTTSAVTPADGRVSEPVRKSAYQAVSDGSKGTETAASHKAGQSVFERDVAGEDKEIEDSASVEDAAPPVEEQVVGAGQGRYLETTEPEAEAEEKDKDWGQDRPFPGSTSRIGRRGRRITVSDFQPATKSETGDSGGDESGSSQEDESGSYQEWHTPTMAPSTRVKKKKRGFFKRLFGIK